MIGDLGYTIQGGGNPKRGWSKGGFSPTSGRLPGILEEKAVEGRGEMPLLQFFENLGGWLKYECRECGRYFNDLTGTIFERHHFPIEEMFYILKEMEAKSTLQISEELGRDYDSKYARRISLEGVVEVEEVYVHAGEKGKKRDVGRRRGLRKRGRGTWGNDKPPVLTIVKKGVEP